MSGAGVLMSEYSCGRFDQKVMLVAGLKLSGMRRGSGRGCDNGKRVTWVTVAGRLGTVLSGISIYSIYIRHCS